MSDSKPTLHAFLICKDVLRNSRAPSVISIINIFNELQVNRFPMFMDSICLAAVYGGHPGNYRHKFEVWEKDQKIGETDDQSFFLETRNSIFHVAAYIDGIRIDGPKHLVIKAFLDGELRGETTLGIFKPLNASSSESAEEP